MTGKQTNKQTPNLDKRTCRGVAYWHVILNELRHQKRNSLGVYSETPRYKTRTNLTVDGCSAQAEAL